MLLLSGLLAFLTLSQEGFVLRPAQRYRIWVSGYTSETVHRYEVDTGLQVGTLEAIPGAQSIRQGPDGMLYVVSEEEHEVHRYDPDGTFLGVFVGDDPATPEDEAGGLRKPTAAAFGPDGNLYVNSFTKNNVLKFDGKTGAFIDIFIDVTEGNLNGPDAGMKFGPDGKLYVPNFNNDRVLHFDGETGEPLGVFASTGLQNPRDIVFHENSVFVSSWGNDRIIRYDLEGNFVSIFATTSRPSGIAFSPFDGDLYTTTDNKNHVKKFDGRTGEALGKVVQNDEGGLTGGTYLTFVREDA